MRGLLEGNEPGNEPANCRKKHLGEREWLRASTALAEDLSPAPMCGSLQQTAYNSRSRRSHALFWRPPAALLMCICFHADKHAFI